MQGIFGLLGAVGIVAAGWLYFDERRNKPKIILQPTATVVPIPGSASAAGGSGAIDAVLLQVKITIENRSSKGLLFNCAAIDIIGLEGSERRVRPYLDDLDGRSLLDEPTGKEWRNCVNKFEVGRAELEKAVMRERLQDEGYVNPPMPTPPARSGARYRDFFMEPGEAATKTLEAIVPCRFKAVRVIFKLPKPDETHDYESKSLVPIADICDAKRNVAILRLQSTGDSAAEAEQIVGASGR